MTRKKVKLQWIANDAARRATFRKRRQGLMKKVQELSILCNVKACAVVYGPYEPQPEVWPSAQEAAALLRSFRSMSEHEQSRRRMDQESFLRQWTQKLREQIEKEKKAARRLQAELLMADCLEGARRVEDLSAEDTTALGCLVERKLKEVQERMDFLRGQQPAAAAAVPAVLEASPPPLLPSSPSMLLPLTPALSPMQHQFSNPYLPPLQPPPFPSTAIAANEDLPDLYIAAAAAGMRSVQGRSLEDQAAVAEEARTDWFIEMAGTYGQPFYEWEGVAPPPLMEDTKNSWVMDPYFPFN